MVLPARPLELDKLCFSSSLSSWQCSVCLLPGHLTYLSSETTQQMEALHRPRRLDYLAEQTPASQPGVVMMLDIISIGMTPPLGTAPSFYPEPLSPRKNSWMGFAGCNFYQCRGELDLRFFSGGLYFLLAVWTSLPDSHSWPESKKKVSGDMIKVTYMMVKNLRSSPSSSICLIFLMPLESSFSWFHFPLVIIRRGNKWGNTHLCRAWWGIIVMMTLSTSHCRYLIKYICDLILRIT